MEVRLRKVLIRVHFIMLATAILNSLLKVFSTYSLESNLELILKLAAVISGLTLFFFYLKPFKMINLYFSIYAFMTLFLTIGIIFRGVFWGVALSIILYPIIPDQKKYEKNDIIISIPFKGFISSCCSYQIKERQLLLFEKNYGVFESEGPIDFNTLKMEKTKNEVELSYSTEFEIKKIQINKYGS